MTSKKRRGGAKRSKKASNLSKTILEYIRGKRYIPSTLSELTKQLDIPHLHKKLFKEVIDELVDRGLLALKSQKYGKPTKESLQTGVINVLSKGFGFVRVDKGPDIFVPRSKIKGAVDGDTVEVEVLKEVSSKGPEGKVIAIVKRSKTHLAGVVMEQSKSFYLVYAPLLGIERPVKVSSKTQLQEGDRVICKVKTWDNKEGDVEADLDRVLGNIHDPSIDVQAAIEEFELPSAFTKEAIAEAKAFGKKVHITENRKDLSSWEIVTIDPTTAKDFDDAISLTKDEKGHYFLGVHIADVANYVKAGSDLDQEAFLRCNSTYFPGTVVPMLPEELSNELCSLKPKVKRLTQSVFAEFNPNGDLVNYSIERTVIHSKKRFTYEEAFEVLEGKKKSPHSPLLKRMVELCHLLKKKRFERGSIDFSMPSNVIIVDSKGVPQRIETVEYDITHQMIEEFMLKANEIVATHLSEKNLGLIYRVHEAPAEDSFQDFFSFARTLGFHLPPEPTRQDIQKLFFEAKNSPHISQLSIAFIRSMRLAAYSTDNLGHYGLALDYYCHFTSPIRRYTDLIIQRLLFNELPDELDIEPIATACSEKERISFRAETSVTQLKKLRLAKAHLNEDPTMVYEAMVTKIKPFALYFEIPLFDIEGNIHVSKIGNDYFQYHPKSMSFQGTRSGKVFKAGQKISVTLESVDFILLQSEWSLVQPKKTKK